MRINLISVESNKVPGKTWKQVDIAYKNDKGELKGKKVPSFSLKRGLDTLLSAKEGDPLDITVVKDGEYWNWTEVSAAASDDAPAKANGKSHSGFSTPSRDFETRLERAARQVLIVRQSCLSTAVNMFSVGKSVPDVKDIISIAKQLEGYVFESSSDEAPEGAESDHLIQ